VNVRAERVAFLSLPDSMTSKLAAGRPQDLVDVQKLRVFAERSTAPRRR